MKEEELEKMVHQEVLRRVERDGPTEPRVINAGGQTEWNSSLLCNVNSNELHVLERAADIIFFFDNVGKVTGWRDDGRTGSPMPAWVDKEIFLKTVVGELGLPKSTRLGCLEPVELPPLGWTHYAVLFLSPVPANDEILRLWVSPKTLRVIQCLYGPKNAPL